MRQYEMKDLGYIRTKTDAWFRVTIVDGEVWEVPVQVIVDSRDSHYVDDKEDTIGYVRDGSIDALDIFDWARNNMNWSDVHEYARRVESRRTIDFEEGWSNGESEIVGKP